MAKNDPEPPEASELPPIWSAMLEAAAAIDRQEAGESAAQGWDDVAEVLPQLFADRSGKMEQGIALLEQRDASGAAAKVMAKLRRILGEFDVLAYSGLCNDEQWQQLIIPPAQALDKGELDEAEAMYSVLYMLRFWSPQPYVGMFTILWQRFGPEVAAMAYETVVNFIPHPMLQYFAADCFLNAGRKKEACALIAQAKEQLENPETGREVDPYLRQEISAFYDELHGSSSSVDSNQQI